MPAQSHTQMKALVLAGGKGTRLRPLTYTMAKQLVPVANKPILHYALDSLFQGGIRDFGIIISPETGDAIRASVREWQAALAEAVQTTFIPQSEPAGLAHAVKIARGYIQDSPFIMYLGDNLINADLKTLIDAFVERMNKQNCQASILLKQVPNPSSFGVAELGDNQQVVRLVEKPKEPKSDLALIGVYLFTARIFEAIEQIKPSWRNELEITDAIQRLIDDNEKVHSSIHEGWWLDTGKKDDLLEANQIVLGSYLKNNIAGQVDSASRLTGEILLGENSQLIDCDIQGPVSIGSHCQLSHCQIGAFTSIGNGCVLSDCHIENSVLLEGCQVSDIQGLIENSLVGKSCKITRSASKQGSHQFLLADHSEIQAI